MTAEYDRSTLGWVKNELDETFRQAATALESFVEDSDELTQLQFCITYLHQITGTLRMVELNAAAMLSLEMERVLQSLADGDIEAKDEVFSSVMQSMLQLPGYLDGLLAGLPDRPIKLLPMINDLRELLGDDLAAATEFFAPDLEADVPLSGKASASVNISDLAKKFTKSFQTSLLAWFKKPTVKKNLKTLLQVITLLQRAATTKQVARLWWVSGGVVEALLDQGLETDATIKQQLGQLERQLKSLADDGESAVAENIPEELVSGLLYQVGMATSDGKLVTAIKVAFRLNEYLPSGSTTLLELSEPNTELLRTVSVAIKEDLARVRDILGVYDGSASQNTADLEPISDILHTVADTLRMTGMAISAELINEQSSAVKTVVAQDQAPTEKQLLSVASTVLHVETTLENLISGRVRSETETEAVPADLGDVPENKYRQVLGVVVQEALNGVASVKDSIDQFVRQSFDHSLLEDAPNQCEQVKGGMFMVAMDRAAGFMDHVAKYIEYALLQQKQEPDEKTLEALADAITSIEYYLEASNEGRPHVEQILNVAEESISELDYVVPVDETVAMDLDAIKAALPQIDDSKPAVESQPEELETQVLDLAAVTDAIEKAAIQKFAQEKAFEEEAEESPAKEEAEELPAVEEHLGDMQMPSEIESESEPEVEREIDEEAAEAEPDVSDLTEAEDAPLAFGEIDETAVMEMPELDDIVADANDVDETAAMSMDELPDFDAIDELEVIEELTPIETDDVTVIMEKPDFSDLELIDSEPGEDTATFELADIPGAAETEAKTEAETKDLPADTATMAAPDLPEVDLKPLDEELPPDTATMAKPEFEESVEIDSPIEPASGDTAIMETPDFVPEEVVAQSESEAEPRIAAVEEIAASSRADDLVPGVAVLSEDYDPETLEIFLEEADEELESIKSHLPAWRAQRADQELLTTIRRSFHTLKGSGRLVGAMLVGEFAWAYEALLNRLIDGKIKADDRLFDLFELAVIALEELVVQLKGGEAPRSPIASLIDQAENFADEVEEVRTVPPSIEPITEEPDNEVLSEPELYSPVVLTDDYDPETLSIFLDEANEELIAIGQRLKTSWSIGMNDNEQAASLRRSFHTLKGSGRLVGAMLLSEFSSAFENLLAQLIDGTIPVNEEATDCVKATEAVLAELIAQLEGGPAPQSDIAALVAVATDLIIPSAMISTEFRAEEIKEVIGALKAANVGDSHQIPELELDEPEDVGVEPILDEEDMQVVTEIESQMDPVLHQIYNQEAQNHLHGIERYLEDCASQAECEITDDLLRYLHTLHGSSRMAGVDDVAEISGKMELIVKELQEKSLLLDIKTRDLIAEMQSASTEIVNAINVPGALSPDCAGLESRLDLALQLVRARPSAVVEDEFEATLPGSMDAHREDVIEQEEPEEIVIEDAAEPQSEPEPEVEPAPEVPTDLTRSREPLPADLDEDLVDIFLEEGEELLDQAENTLQLWLQEKHNNDHVLELQRQLHTIKGGARMAGLASVGDLSHAMESVLTRIVDGHMPVGKNIFDLMNLAVDRLVVVLEQVSERQATSPVSDVLDLINGLLHERTPGQIEAPADDLEPDIESEPVIEKPVFEMPETPVAPSVVEIKEAEEIHEGVLAEEDVDQTDDRRQGSRVQHETVRVRAELIDSLVNYAGEIGLFRSRLEQQMNIFNFNLEEMDRTVTRVREQVRKMEIETEAQMLYRFEKETDEEKADFDPLELDRFSQLQQLSRTLTEGVYDLTSLESVLANVTRESETLLLQQSRVTTDLQEGLMRSRMVEFSGLIPRMRRILRQISKELKKDVQLKVTGADVEMDSTVIDRVVPAIEHILRNAVAHGIETAKTRKAAGKSETGTIKLNIARAGGDVVITIADDGAGINYAAIQAKAEKKGLIEKGAKLTNKELLQFILESGMSTADQITQISGRGVGLDVVVSETKQLGGNLSIDSVAGKGSTFVIQLPFTLAIIKSLMVQLGDDTFAIPLHAIDGISRIPYAEFEKLKSGDEVSYSYAGQDYEFSSLDTLLAQQTGVEPVMGERVPLLFVRAGERLAAIQVQSIIGSREIVVKSVGPQLSIVRGLLGATLLGDGRVVLILDLGALLRHGVVLKALESIDAEKQAPEKFKTKVMVVDDSITIRKVTTRLLERNDYEVVTAKDGVDAVTMLQEYVPDIMLLDIEMPRMDGYELATHMRAEDKLKQIPIIMITSRTGSKHRDRAMKIGVNEYLGKPYQETELLETIEATLKSESATVE